MAIIDLPQPYTGIEAGLVEAPSTEKLLQHETKQALGKAALFLDNERLAETNIVNAGDYSGRPAEWDEVISRAYEHFGATPPLAENRSWTPLGPEAEYGWLSSVSRKRIGLDPNGKYIALRLFDTIVERPDGTQARTLYANRLGLPKLPKIDSKMPSNEELSRVA